MKKIPTLYVRDEEDRSLVTEEITDGLDWVLEEATPTVKWDGTACMWRDGLLYKRRTIRWKQDPTDDFEPCGKRDPETGKWVGWVLVDLDSKEDAPYLEAAGLYEVTPRTFSIPDGTYELLGPKIQGNPHKFETHRFVGHGYLAIPMSLKPTNFSDIRAYLALGGIEGIVWWYENAPVAKIKAKDFGILWPSKETK